ncbi:unnamed protein product, partial [Boreogadus saida]
MTQARMRHKKQTEKTDMSMQQTDSLNATLIWDGRVRQSSSDLTEPSSHGTEPALRRDSLSPPQTGQPQPTSDGTEPALPRRNSLSHPQTGQSSPQTGQSQPPLTRDRASPQTGQIPPQAGQPQPSDGTASALLRGDRASPPQQTSSRTRHAG